MTVYRSVVKIPTYVKTVNGQNIHTPIFESVVGSWLNKKFTNRQPDEGIDILYTHYLDDVCCGVIFSKNNDMLNEFISDFELKYSKCKHDEKKISISGEKA